MLSVFVFWPPFLIDSTARLVYVFFFFFFFGTCCRLSAIVGVDGVTGAQK